MMEVYIAKKHKIKHIHCCDVGKSLILIPIHFRTTSPAMQSCLEISLRPYGSLLPCCIPYLNVNVNVHAHTPGIPLSSADCIITGIRFA